MSNKPDYSKQWADLTERMVAFFAAWIGGFILVSIGSAFHLPGWLLFGLWTIAFIWTGTRWSNFKCPRCGGSFFKFTMGVNQYARRCYQCGLKKWSSG